MKINKDYMLIMRTGRWLDSSTYRKQIESATLLLISLSLAGILILVSILVGVVK